MPFDDRSSADRGIHCHSVGNQLKDNEHLAQLSIDNEGFPATKYGDDGLLKSTNSS